MTRHRLIWTAVFLLIGSGAGTAIASPDVNIDEIAVCLQCHAEIEDAVGSKVKHSPAKDGDCSSCHNPHVARFGGLLLDRPGPMCGACHDGIVEELQRTVVHMPAADGGCADCHEPHGGDHAGLLVRPGAALCAECHPSVEAWQSRGVSHPPFESGECAGCHEPHGAEHDALMATSITENCMSCHDADLAFRSAHKSYPVEGADCLQCHDPHASSRSGLFRANTHAPFAAGSCTTCHALAGSDEPFRTRVPIDQLCGECHQDVVDRSRSASLPHVSAGGGDCQLCHNAHSADGRALLHRPVNRTCLGCHDPGGSSSGLEGRFVSHGEEHDMECTTCHDPHGGDRPLLFVSGANDLCKSCHEHQHSVAHPQGEDVLDPRTDRPVDCLSCHGLHDSPYPKYLFRDGKRELCVMCHKAKGGVAR